MPEMPDVVTLTTISSDWGNDIRDRTIQRYSSVANRTTEHPSPTEGDLSYLEDSNTVWVYDGAAWMHLGPSGVGKLGYVADSTNQSAINTETDLTNLTRTVTVLPNRLIRISCQTSVASTAANSQGILRLKEGTTLLGSATVWSTVADGFFHVLATAIVSAPSLGNHTYKATLQRTAGSNFSRSGASYFLVEDIGPA